MGTGSAGRREGWRWNINRHPKPTRATIVVSEPTEEQQAERQRKIEQGAQIVPFGFSRVLNFDPPTGPVDLEDFPFQQPLDSDRDPQLWEGDQA